MNNSVVNDCAVNVSDMDNECEYNRSSEKLNVSLKGLGAVRVSVIEGRGIIEGDIDLGPVDQLILGETPDRDKLLLLGSGIIGVGERWTGGVIPYAISSTLENKGRVYGAIRYWARHTNLRFVPRTQETNYVEFVTGTICSSPIGMVGNRQVIQLANTCLIGNVMHEIGHAVGLFHEHNRHDRDSFITVNEVNILADDLDQFEIKDTSADIGRYDYNSIMHYGARAFSSNGLDTITSSQPIGQRRMLSPRDLYSIAYLYGFGLRDTYLSGDFNGDGRHELAVRRRDNIIRQRVVHDRISRFSTRYGGGQDEDEYFVIDWNGDGKAELGVRRGSRILLQNSITDTVSKKLVSFGRGNAEDQYLVGDWNGDGKETFAVRRGDTVHFQRNIDDNTASSSISYGSGNTEDEYFAINWDGLGHKLAVRRNDLILMQGAITDPVSRKSVKYGGGDSEDQYLIGDWNGDGKDELAVRRRDLILFQNVIDDTVSKFSVEYGGG